MEGCYDEDGGSGETTPPEPVLSSPSPEEQALKNGLILRRLLSKCEGVSGRTLRLVHPLWNEEVMSSQNPRLSLCLPFLRREEDEEAIKDMDPRLMKSLKVEDGDVSTPTPVLNTVHQLKTFVTSFSDSITHLDLVATEFGTFKASVLLLRRTCPNLKRLDMKVTLVGDSALRSLADLRIFAALVNNSKFEVKGKLESFRFVLGDFYEEEKARTSLLTILQAVLDVSPNLKTLHLKANFKPSLKNQIGLKQLSWTIPFLPLECGEFLHEYDNHIGRSIPAFFCYQNIGDFLPDNLEELDIGFEGIKWDCAKCLELFGGKHMPSLVLPNLRRLKIINCHAFMLSGGIGFENFSQKNMPRLESLEFDGPGPNFVEYEGRLGCESLGVSPILVHHLDLGNVAIDACLLRMALSRTDFPNVTSLALTITHTKEDAERSFAYFLQPILNNCMRLDGLQELKISCPLNVCMRHFLFALEDSLIFRKSNGLRKFTFDLCRNTMAGGLMRDEDWRATTCHNYAVALAKCLLKTKDMEKVSLLNLSFPVSVLVPVMQTIKRLKLPVSFGSTELTDRALDALTLEEEEKA